MDIYCPVCGEPWAIDELHDVPDAGFDAAWRRFSDEGCSLFGSGHNGQPDTAMATKSAMLHNVLGDDIDGIASLMDE
ncbi:MAG: hypothetical protein GEU80_17765 [Dehalococcoidia bacterium]|nr:hypothetical protein [Dehalococcoidia bacterium]